MNESIGGRIVPVKSVERCHPHGSLTIQMERGDAVGLSRRGRIKLRQRQAVRAPKALRCPDPQTPGCVLRKRKTIGIGKHRSGCAVEENEPHPIEPGQSTSRGQPDVSVVALENGIDLVVGQSLLLGPLLVNKSLALPSLSLCTAWKNLQKAGRQKWSS